MKASCRNRVLVVAGILVLGFASIALIPGKPVHGGKSLSYWLTQLDQRYNLTNTAATGAAYEALQAMGTNTLAILRGELRARDSELKTRILRLLGQQSLFKVPLAPAEVRRRHAVLACKVLGPLAAPLIPDLADLLNSADGRIIGAGEALASIGPEVAPILLKGLNHSNATVRLAALLGLRELGYSARSVAPEVLQYIKAEADPKLQSLGHLVRMFMVEIEPDGSVPLQVGALEDTSAVRRWSAARMLGSYGREASAALPALQKALGDPHPDVRIEAAHAIWRIQRNEQGGGE